MISRKLTIILFSAVVLLAAVLRFYDLGKNPPGINLDEAAIGWNAYSILKTGRDEYGQFLPLVFRSLDDYKPPLYIYLTVPAEAVLGMTEFAVRLPSAILGVGAVVLTFFLAREIFREERDRATLFGLLSAFILAISPWHLHFTRTAYETGSCAFFTAGGLLFFFVGLRKKRWFFFALSAVFFGLELYLYQAAKVFVPLLLFSLFCFYFREIKNNLRLFIPQALIIFVLALPVLYQSTTLAGQMRFLGTSVFQDPKLHNINLSYQRDDWFRRDRISAAVLHPEVLSYASDVLWGYFSHLSPNFFFSGGNGSKVDYVSNMGLLYYWEMPFLLSGLFYLYKAKNKKPAWLLTAWMLAAPVPASVTIGVPSSIRTAVFLPSLQIIGAYGLVNFTAMVKKNYPRFLPVFVAGLFGVVTFSLYFYLHMYYIHAPRQNSKIWYYGYRQIAEDSAKLAPKYNKIIVSNTLDQPLNFWLFFLKYDPKTYLTVDGGTISGGFKEDRNHFSKYYFKPVSWDELKSQPGILVITVAGDLPKEVPVLKTYHYLDGRPSVIMAATNP